MQSHKSGVERLEHLKQPCIVRGCSRSATYSVFVCSDCVHATSERLREIGELWLELSASPTSGRGDGQPTARGKRMPAPARLDVIAAMDRRSVPYAIGPDDVDGDVRSVPGTLSALVAWINEEIDYEPYKPITHPIRYLMIRLPLAAGRQWFDELAADIDELHAQLLRLTGRAERRTSLAPCPLCDGPLHHVGTGVVVAAECRVCGKRYEGLQLIELGRQRANEGLETK
ncbi:hypothetical protein [Saccharopolyspora hattusasensis]|uniref:hypothetical protein n=1 Tax=Saccharopolyspora hattusasensis TaxID=1128679 RepID=UPI003D952F4F